MRKLLHSFLTVIKWTALALVALVLAVNVYTIVRRKAFNDPFPTVFGYGSAVVVSDSMETAISRGDVIVVRKSKSYQVGDVLTYEDDGAYVTHRLVEIQGDEYITQGDNNDSKDKPFSRDKVVGRVVFVLPKVGNALSFFSSPFGIFLLGLGGAAILFVPDWIREWKEEREEGKNKEERKEDKE